jgi:hypothetical protein
MSCGAREEDFTGQGTHRILRVFSLLPFDVPPVPCPLAVVSGRFAHLPLRPFSRHAILCPEMLFAPLLARHRLERFVRERSRGMSCRGVVEDVKLVGAMRQRVIGMDR